MNFLFLELRDEEICTLLHGLRERFSGRPSKSNIHITVRGPYVAPLTDEDIQPYREVMTNDKITISDAGMFHNPDRHVVFLNVSSPNLERIWWKRDYPKDKFGFNPHISIYRGKDRRLAERINEFLVNENLCLECKSFELTPYVSNQYCLFRDEQRKYEKHFLRHIINGKVRGDILERAKQLVEHCSIDKLLTEK